MEYIWVGGHFLEPIMYFNMIVEEALDTHVYNVRSRVYPGHLHDTVLGLIVFQARYSGLCAVMYVDACYSTHQLILNQFTRIYTLCMWKPRNSEFVQLIRHNRSREFFPTWPFKSNFLHADVLQRY